MKQILVRTSNATVYAGEIPDTQDLFARSMPIKNAKMAIYWGTTHGIAELAELGPNKKSKIGLPADIEMLHDIIEVFAITPMAWEEWLKA